MPANLSADTLLTRDDSPISADMDGEIVMLSMQTNNYYGLGEVGSRLWILLESPQTPRQLCARLSEGYAVSQDTCIDDILPFLQQLLEEKLIKLLP